MTLADDVFRHSEGEHLGAELWQIERLLQALGHGEGEPLDLQSVARLWKRFLEFESEKRSAPDAPEKLAFLSWLEVRLGREGPEWDPAFRLLGLNFVRSRLEVRLRLGGRLFSKGRKPGAGKDSQAIRKALSSASC